MNASKLNRKHQQMRESIHYLHHNRRNQLRLLNNWISELLATGNHALTQTFILESLSQLLNLLSDVPIIGSEPDFFLIIQKNISAVCERFPSSFDELEIAKANGYLDKYVISLYAYLGIPMNYKMFLMQCALMRPLC